MAICGELLAKHYKLPQIAASVTFAASTAFIAFPTFITFIIFYYFHNKIAIKVFFYNFPNFIYFN